MVSFDEVKKSVLKGQIEKAKDLSASLVQSGENPLNIIDDGLIAGMNEVGIKFKAGDMFVPEVIMSAKAMSAGVDAVKPFIKGDEIKAPGVVVVGTVKGDLHDIGKNLVCMILESAGFKVIDIGVDNSAEQFIEAVKEHHPQIVGMSALLTTTMPFMKETIDAFVEEGIRNTIKIIVGGAPVSRQFAEKIGADGYGEDAISARDLCVNLVS
ncbi:MAG: corrinoid protein [Syntrophaceticus sp.]|jgi:5-methyltetrahydrofolate--homocysteine methyltransferase